MRIDRRAIQRLLLLTSLIYWAAGAEAGTPRISGVTRGNVKLSAVPNTPTGQSWRYGLGAPWQLDATTVGLMTNIRRNGTPYGDFEVGNDLILFNDLKGISTGQVVPLSRSSAEPNPINGDPSLTAKYPITGGFVPRGARLPDGSPALHGGSGFGISQVAFYPSSFLPSLPPEDQLGYRLEVQQYRYDGSQFTASAAQRVTQWAVGDSGWRIVAPGLAPALPDGNDLLMGVTCANASAASVAGVARFHYGVDGWQPASFMPVTDLDATWWEPSMIRDADGSLLFTARNNHVNGTGDIPLWRSTDGSQTWDQRLFLKGARTGTTLVLNQAIDGTPCFATNTTLGTDRNILEIVPLNAARDGLESPITARNGSGDFGPAPSGMGWKVDHGIGSVVQLADGQWHSILAYRVLDQGENYGGPTTPYSGIYVEEVFSTGGVHPTGFIFVPEPSCATLLIAGLLGLIGFACYSKTYT